MVGAGAGGDDAALAVDLCDAVRARFLDPDLGRGRRGHSDRSVRRGMARWGWRLGTSRYRAGRMGRDTERAVHERRRGACAAAGSERCLRRERAIGGAGSAVAAAARFADGDGCARLRRGRERDVQFRVVFRGRRRPVPGAGAADQSRSGRGRDRGSGDDGSGGTVRVSLRRRDGRGRRESVRDRGHADRGIRAPVRGDDHDPSDAVRAEHGVVRRQRSERAARAGIRGAARAGAGVAKRACDAREVADGPGGERAGGAALGRADADGGRRGMDGARAALRQLADVVAVRR